MTAHYPQIGDWSEHRAGRLTSILGAGPAMDLALGLTDAGDALEQAFEQLSREVADLSGAGLPVLRRVGESYGVSISGLSLSEARLIVQGAALASTSRGSWSEVAATWAVATGGSDLSSTLLSRGCVIMGAVVEVAPTDAYLLAAELVMRRAMPAGYGLHGWLRLPSGGAYDDSRYDESTYSWSVTITRPEE